MIINSFSDVRNWLTPWVAAPPASQTITKAMFGAPYLIALFDVVSQAADNANGVALSSIRATVSADQCTLSGIAAKYAGCADSSVSFLFSESEAGDLLCELTAVLGDLNWSPIQGYQLCLNGISSRYIPWVPVALGFAKHASNPYLLNAAFTASASLGKLAFPTVTVEVPCAPGAWGVQADLSSSPLSFSEQDIQALAFGHDVIGKILNGYFHVDRFQLDLFELSLDTTDNSIPSIRAGIRYNHSWDIITFSSTRKITVDKLYFTLSLYQASTVPTSIQATVAAVLAINSFSLNVEVLFDYDVKAGSTAVSLYASEHNLTLQIGDAFDYFNFKLPSCVPADITLSEIGLVVFPQEPYFEFFVAVTDVSISAAVTLDALYFDLTADLSAPLYAGDLSAVVVIDRYRLTLAGSYDEGGGMSLAGSFQGIDVGKLLAGLAARFGFDVDAIPDFIRNIYLDSVTVSFDSDGQGHTLGFQLVGATGVAHDAVGFNLAVTHSAGDLSITGSIDNLPLSGLIGFLFAELDVDLRNLPEIDLSRIQFSVDPTKATFSLQASCTLGAIACQLGIASQKDSTTKAWEFISTIDVQMGIPLDVGALAPVIGDALAGRIAIDSLNVYITSPNASIVGTAPPDLPFGGSIHASLVIDNEDVDLYVPFYHYQAPPSAGGGPAGTVAPASICWHAMEKTFGPVSVQKLGFHLSSGKLWNYLDAAVGKSGLTIAPEGLAIGLDLSTLKQPSFTPQLTVNGLAIHYQNPAVTVGGGFTGTLSPLDFSGMVSARFARFDFAALAEYQQFTFPSGTAPSFFVFLIVNELIGGPPYCFITGLAGGFGYNQALTVPAPAGLDSFPFVEAVRDFQSATTLPDAPLAPGMGPTGALAALTSGNTITPAVGEDWLALGVTFTTFNTIRSFALVTVSFGTDFEVNVIGSAIASFPVGSVAPVAYVVLDLEASFQPQSGTLAVSGCLSNSSYVLSPDAHLTGGFAFYTWFSGPHQGDFVITVGGYDSRATIPSYYPQEPRLGLNWQLDDRLSIKGEEYFALTPKFLMAGGALDAVWNGGSIQAWFLAHADFCIEWKPLRYQADIGVSLGASFTLELALFSVHVTISVGADLRIWGPSFSGVATIHLSIISFTVSFGEPFTPSQKLGFHDFVDQFFPVPNPTKPSAGLGASPPPPQICHIHLMQGLVKTLDDSGIDWVVSPDEFRVRLYSLIPSTTYTPFLKNITLSPTAPPPVTTSFGVRPCHLTSVASTLTVTVTNSQSPSTFVASPILENIPKALWDYAKSEDDLNYTDSLLGAALGGFELTAPVTIPDVVGPMPVGRLKVTNEANIAFAWPVPLTPTRDSFSAPTVPSTIGSALAGGNRPLLLNALTQYNRGLNTKIDVSGLEHQSTDYLQVPPCYRLLGEEKGGA